MVAQLLQPALHVLVRATLRDVVHEQRADGPAVVAGEIEDASSALGKGVGKREGGNDARSGDGTVTLLAGFSMV